MTMNETYQPGDRVYLVGGSFDTWAFGIWTGTVTKCVGGYWVWRDDESEASYWTPDGMFRDRDAALDYATLCLRSRLESLDAKRKSAMRQHAEAVREPVVIDEPVAR